MSKYIDSAKNQRIIQKFVKREVVYCITSLVNDIQQKDPDDENFGIYNFENIDTQDDEYLEVYEYYIISDWLYGKLKEHNEIVIDNDYFYIWGRTCTGQSIFLDYVIQKICNDMGILEGGEYEWNI